MIRSLILILLTGIVLSCERDPAPNRMVGYDYFPLEVGSFREYEVLETKYALARAPENSNYRIRETVGEIYTDAVGQDVYRIERALWKDNTWKVDSIWTAWRTIDRAFRTENGLSYVKLVFPLEENVSWDGNEFNASGEKLYRLSDLSIPKQVGTEVFDNTLTVVQESDSTLLSLRKSQEVYAQGVGLVSSERVYIQYCGTPDCVGKGIIDYGFKQKSVITKFGK